MTWLASDLWALMRKRPVVQVQPAKKRGATINRKKAAKKAPSRMQLRYDGIVVEMKQKYGIRINKWRSSMSGCAWEVAYRDGTLSRLIESPYPKGPMSCAVFLHEIGHHAIGLHRYRPRCLEEYLAWKWSLEAMVAHDVKVTDRVQRRVADSLWYAVRKARKRGLKKLPVELVPFLERVPVGQDPPLIPLSVAKNGSDDDVDQRASV